MVGKLIVFEGIDGSGKTTQANLLFDRLPIGCVGVYRELYTTDLGQRIKKILEEESVGYREEALLFATARWSLYNRFIHNYMKGDTIICDRFKASAIAVSVFGRGLRREFIENLLPSIVPNLTILLDVNINTAIKRYVERNSKSQIEDKLSSNTSLESIRNGFLIEGEKRVGEGENWLLLDGLENQVVLSNKIWEAVQELFLIQTEKT